MYLIRATLLLTCAALLQSCAGVSEVKPAVSPAAQALYQQHLHDIAAIGQFTLKGRIGVQTNGKGFSGSLLWQHGTSGDDIALYSPLGSQIASIKKNAGLVTLDDANGNSMSAADAETLTQTALGWRLPLTGLADWSLGRPANSHIQASTWDEQGFLSTLKQDGWDIEYQNYTKQNGYFLPGKILLKSEKINLKLLVEQWSSLN